MKLLLFLASSARLPPLSSPAWELLMGQRRVGRSGISGGDAARACDEVDRPGCYGWCAGYLWFDYCCHHQYWN
ncbi:unnamed protein product [Coffea canephora]|uniref:Uncharacterized protein n=1 Tax=Coffea canephora TaxID=49390 RepID=A0A068V1I2_COFCA|nr:unnamed protein product [Coffea canephora]